MSESVPSNRRLRRLLILGAALCGIVLLFALVGFLTRNRTKPCLTALTKLGHAMIEYASRNEGKFPDRLEELLSVCESPEVAYKFLYYCPNAKGEPESRRHILVTGLCSDMPSTCILAYDPPTSHQGKRGVLFLDGHVTILTEEEFQQRLMSTHAAREDRRKDSRPSAAPQGLTAAFQIHLQDGFDGSSVVITVDGVVTYSGRPKTNNLLGIAQIIETKAATRSPVIGLTSPEMGINWSAQVDLDKGQAVGLSGRGGSVIMRQAKAFGYD